MCICLILKTQYSLRQLSGQIRLQNMSEYFSFHTDYETTICVSLSIIESYLYKNGLVSLLTLSWHSSPCNLASTGSDRIQYTLNRREHLLIWNCRRFGYMRSKIWLSNFTPHRGNQLQEKTKRREGRFDQSQELSYMNWHASIAALYLSSSPKQTLRTETVRNAMFTNPFFETTHSHTLTHSHTHFSFLWKNSNSLIDWLCGF